MTEDSVRRLIQDGRAFDLPDAEICHDLHELESKGVVSTTQTRVFRCSDRPGGLPLGPIDRSCDSIIEFRGPTEPHLCDQCVAEHWLDEEEAGLGHRVRVHVVREGVERRLDQYLNRLDDRCRRMPDAVAWRVFVGGRDVYVCVLDWSKDSRFVTRAFASTNAVVYVVVDWRHFAGRFPEGLGEVLPLYKIIANEAELGRALTEAPDGPHPLVVSEPPPPVWNPSPTPKPLVYRQVLGARELVVSEKVATLDGVEVLGSRATALLTILRFLVERWHEDLVDGKAPDDHCCFTVGDIREHLRDDQGRAPTEGTVRKRLTRIRHGIPERYQAQARRTLGPDAVIEHVDGFGYRLRPLGLAAHIS